MSIWVLTSRDNDYNQPENNLVAWWSKKPTIDQVCQVVFSCPFPPDTDNQTLEVVRIWSGRVVLVEDLCSHYTLKELIKEGPL